MSASDVLDAQMRAALWECCPPEVVSYLQTSAVVDEARLALVGDAQAFARKDPASNGEVLKVIQTYTSFRAVLHCRLAHAMHARAEAAQDREAIALYASMISSRGKVLSGAELHHKCKIGKRFVLDHGIGTVLGESSSIGDDCYLLGGVTLGARGIANNPNGKRHPSIGNRVQIGAFSRIFGTVSIGDDVFISPHCTITEDIPARSRVTLRTSIQIVERKMRTPLTHRIADHTLMGLSMRDGTATPEPVQGDTHEI